MSWVNQVKKIVRQKQYRRVDGIIVDGFTASAMVQVFDALSEANQAKFAALPICRAVDVTWKLLKNQESKNGV